MKARVRIDQLLTDRGLVDSRNKAQALVLAGQVLADEKKIEKPGQQVNPECEIRILGEKPRYVSRAGFKLEGALIEFIIDIQGKVCLDIGASTGGFTDCLLQHGAAKVYAVDVGTNQLDWRIRQDARVMVHEQTNAKDLSEQLIPEPIQFVCCDVSFISATLVLPPVAPLLANGAEIVVLAKPQFEAGRGEVGKGGIVRSDAIRQAAADKVRQAIDALGFRSIKQMDSPVEGAQGNREILLYGSNRELNS
ncbi:MAG: TlyA family RNA methyltransferase [Acidobacteria bacterium]|nr:TlyA family RNA methyltransferase [Acidobacteriota bacterium]MDA1235301.1 TlyA family RNA methyltransferase [Acidobacteriota bacterium]